MLTSIEGKKPANEAAAKKPAKAQRESAKSSRHQGIGTNGVAKSRVHAPGPQKPRRGKTYPLGWRSECAT